MVAFVGSVIAVPAVLLSIGIKLLAVPDAGVALVVTYTVWAELPVTVPVTTLLNTGPTPTLHVAEPQLAEMDVVPGDVAVTPPDVLTVATWSCDECQSRLMLVNATPLVSKTSATRVWLELFATENDVAVEPLR